MNHHPYGSGQDQMSVAGFEIPDSPDASFNNIYNVTEDEGHEPPMLPLHLHHTRLNFPTYGNAGASLIFTQNVTLNHLYIENREPSRSVVGLGVTHRFRSKYVTAVLCKAVPRR